jgi:hypothetical protein
LNWEQIERKPAELRQRCGNQPREILGSLAIRLIMRPLPTFLWAISDPLTKVVHLNSELPSAHQNFALAHELAHFVVRGEDVDTGGDEELWADWFGHELLLPRVELAASLPTEWAKLTSSDDIPEMTLGAQILRLHGLPILRCSDGTVVCRNCGHRRLGLFGNGCPCLPYRQEYGDRPGRLPSLAETVSMFARAA